MEGRGGEGYACEVKGGEKGSGVGKWWDGKGR